MRLMLEIAKALDAAGVNEIEIGVPVRGESTRIYQALLPLCRAKASAWCRARREDIASVPAWASILFIFLCPCPNVGRMVARTLPSLSINYRLLPCQQHALGIPRLD